MFGYCIFFFDSFLGGFIGKYRKLEGFKFYCWDRFMLVVFREDCRMEKVFGVVIYIISMVV